MEKLYSINLIYIRERNRYNQRDFADLFGITQTTLSNYERGKSEPSLSFVVAICKRFEVSLDNFVFRNLNTVKPTRLTDDEKQDFNEKISLYRKIIEEKDVIIATKNEHIDVLNKSNNMLQVLLNQNKKP